MTDHAIDVFFSYSHRDEALRDELEDHLSLLKREGAIRTWHDRGIGAGEAWEDKIDRHLTRADLILLLISPAFMASEYCYGKEMTRALERHDAGEATVVPIILRPTYWQGANFARLQALPRDGRPVVSWPNQDEAFLEVVLGLRAAINNILDRRNRRKSEFGGTSVYSSLFHQHAPGKRWEDPSLGLRLCYIPPGTFEMGSPEEEPGRYPDEYKHPVTLTRGFWLGETPVTQAQWRAVMGNNPSKFKKDGDHCPVERVNWYEALAFANILSEWAGLPSCYEFSGGNGKKAGEGLEFATVRFTGPACPGYRLPTEAEWEYAARAGTPTAIYTGELTVDGWKAGQELNAIAWWEGNSGGYTQPVGQKVANPWNLQDMLGNVWEWCWDSSVGTPYAQGAVTDPQGMGSAAGRVIRGGSWGHGPRYARVAARFGAKPSVRDDALGFRMARSAL